MTALAVAFAAVLALAGPASAAPYPQNNGAPQLQGPSPPQDGVTYTVKAGSWTGPPGQSVQVTRQWLRCNSAGGACAAIAGATGTSYTLGAADAGARVRVRETASCAFTTPICSPATSDSGLTAVVLRDPLNEAAPQISGTAQVGQLLSASVGFWRSPSPLRFSYQWTRCDSTGAACSPLGGATGPDLRVAAAEAGARLRVVVTAGNSRPRSAETASAATAPVAAAPVVRKRKAPRKKRGARLLSPFPRIVIAGIVTGGAAELTEFTIRGPRGALVGLRCRGRGCPFRARRLRMRARKVRVRSLERRWRPGAVLEVTVGRRGFIGKFSRFRFRAGNVPRRQDQCLAPGAKKPRRCPRAAR